MKIVLRLLGLFAIWSLVAGIIIFIDPVVIRDVGIPGSYLPFTLMVFGAAWYTSAILVRNIWIALVTALLVTLGLELSIVRVLYWFVMLGILGLLGVVYYLYFSRLKHKQV